jgi:hypothetical protein
MPRTEDAAAESDSSNATLCENCSKALQKPLVCARCKTATYCSRDCQVHTGLNCPKKNDEMFSKIPAHLNTQGLRNDNMSEEQWQGNQERPKQEFTAAANPLIKKQFSFHARIQLEFELIPTSVYNC